jgi:hypothetical protein
VSKNDALAVMPISEPPSSETSSSVTGAASPLAGSSACSMHPAVKSAPQRARPIAVVIPIFFINIDPFLVPVMEAARSGYGRPPSLLVALASQEFLGGNVTESRGGESRSDELEARRRREERAVIGNRSSGWLV